MADETSSLSSFTFAFLFSSLPVAKAVLFLHEESNRKEPILCIYLYVIKDWLLSYRGSWSPLHGLTELSLSSAQCLVHWLLHLLYIFLNSTLPTPLITTSTAGFSIT
jgi:hypothetical protein